MVRNHTLKLFALVLALAANPAVSCAQGADAPQLDLDEINRIIDASDDVGPPQDEFGRSVTLEEAIKIALEHTLQLQIDTLEVEAQLPEISFQKAKFHPLLGLSFLADGAEVKDEISNNTASIDNSIAGLASVDQQISTGGSISVTADMSRLVTRGVELEKDTADVTIVARQPLLKGGRVYVARQAIRNAQYQNEILEALLHARILNVTALTKIAYYDTILRGNLLDVTTAALVRDHDLLEASNALFGAGRVNKRDVFSAEIKIAKDQARLAKDLASIEDAQNNLRDILGLPLDMQLEVTDTEIPFEPVKIEIEDWIRSAIANRPEILAIRTSLEQQDLEVMVQRNSVLPNLDLVGSYGRSQTGFNARRAFDLSGHSWTAGFDFSIPFGNVAARSNLAKARTDRARIERRYVAEERRIELEVRSFEITLRRNIGELKANTKGLEQARAKREIASVRFQLGLADNFDITDADQDLIDAETELLTAITEYAINLARIEAAIVRPI